MRSLTRSQLKLRSSRQSRPTEPSRVGTTSRRRSARTKARSLRVLSRPKRLMLPQRPVLMLRPKQSRTHLSLRKMNRAKQSLDATSDSACRKKLRARRRPRPAKARRTLTLSLSLTSPLSRAKRFLRVRRVRMLQSLPRLTRRSSSKVDRPHAVASPSKSMTQAGSSR